MNRLGAVNRLNRVNGSSSSGYDWAQLLTNKDVLARYIYNAADNRFYNNSATDLIEMVDTISGITIGANGITNPSFATDTTGCAGNGNHAIARITTDFVSSPACLQVTSSGAGVVGSDRIMFSPGFLAINKTYKVKFYAKSISGNTSLTVSDTGGSYQKAITVTSEWVLYEYYFRKYNAGAAFVMFLGGAGVILFDDLSAQEITNNGVALVQYDGTKSPLKENDDVFFDGVFDMMVSANFAETPVSIYIVGEKYVAGDYNEYSPVQVFNRVIEFGEFLNSLRIGSDANSLFFRKCTIKEILIRKTDDSYLTKWRIDKTYQGIYGGDLPEITNRDILVNKLVPYCNEDNFIFCTGSDFHLNEYSTLPVLIDLIKSDARLLNNVKFISAHGDIIVRNQLAVETALQVIAYVNYYVIPNLTKGIPIYTSIGNHDTGMWVGDDSDNTVALALTNAQQQATFIDPVLAVDPTIVTDALNTTGRYYYKDFTDRKIRIIYLNPYDSPDTSTAGTFDYIRDDLTYSEAQLTWLCDYALKLPDSDYHVVIVSHDPASIAYNGDIRSQLLVAFKTNGAFNITINANGRNFNLVRDFNTINGFNGVLAMVLMGHNHVPLIEKYENSYFITNIGSYTKAEMEDWDRSLGSLREYASDFFVINKTARNIKILRYGAMRATAGDPNDNGDRGFANNAYDTIMTY